MLYVVTPVYDLAETKPREPENYTLVWAHASGANICMLDRTADQKLRTAAFIIKRVSSALFDCSTLTENLICTDTFE